MASPIQQRVLVYDRIAQNRTRTALLVTLAVLSIVPFLGAMGVGAYRALGWFAFVAAPLQPDYQGPFARMRDYQEKLAATPPEKLARLYPEYEHLYRAETKLFKDQRSGRLSADALRQEIDRLNAESERLAEQTERLIDPQGVQRRQERKSDDQDTRMWLTVVVTLCVAAALAVVFWGLVKSPGAKALTLSGARPAGRAEAENEARRLLENLAIGAGLPPPKLYMIDSMAPNAFAVGMDPQHSTVAVTAGVLQLLDRRELEGVLAHELAHIGNRDTRLSTAVFAITLYLRLPSLLWKGVRQENQSFTERRFGLGRLASRVAGVFVFVYVFFVAPALALLIRAAISRRREALADADAALLTRNPEGMVRALAKIAGAGSAVINSNPIVSHLYFADPSEAGIGVGFFSGMMLSSHPPIEQRIARLLEFGAAVPPSVIEEARKAGADFAIENPPRTLLVAPLKAPEDELTALSNADTRSRAFRLLGTAPVALYERDDPQSWVVAHLLPGTFLVGFQYSSKMRQVITHDRTFGYISRKAPLESVPMTPEEVFHMAKPAAPAQPSPAPKPATEPRPAVSPPPAPSEPVRAQPVAQPAPQPSPAAEAAILVPSPQPRLTSAQTLVWALVGVLAVGGLIVGVVMALKALAGR